MEQKVLRNGVWVERNEQKTEKKVVEEKKIIPFPRKISSAPESEKIISFTEKKKEKEGAREKSSTPTSQPLVKKLFSKVASWFSREKKSA